MNYDFKGTPYPWTRKGFKIWSVPKIETQLGNNTITGEWKIADAESGYIRMPHEQKFHNACIMAAAPELLEALKDAKDTIEWMWNNFNHDKDNVSAQDAFNRVANAMEHYTAIIHKALNIQP
ncbi:hypothetical protein VF04_36740 [Nostoc linckia z7]|uniref:Uncharacterized protein n=1 Tax=Nostoc linckia z7 TaxID=1628745 RepID=A0ABX4KIW9_NOSLI|nr:hypothetical protein [Nostoc linckia]PHJ52035.1 hypothetical protein VF02_37770 [Nostoc linckia z1]PHJ59301.1 hypothetical protein VF05_32435 [Nostoc linckia z3]PHJ63626.1 hypothetical protein VF03_29945 [Nostoc linckia z2]PHJ70430.1 hypothetical protein VF06_37640 [Nostoc linckia z4]PHJ83480.1 hypothetical protein VF04_36740 [Nostoc linckia z7]